MKRLFLNTVAALTLVTGAAYAGGETPNFQDDWSSIKEPAVRQYLSLHSNQGDVSQQKSTFYTFAVQSSPELIYQNGMMGGGN